MKKIILLFFILAISITCVNAKGSKDYTVKFNGTKYHLLYSVKNKDFGGYLNEYYKKGETYNIWTELVAVHHFPNAYSPIDRIREFKDYLGSMKVPSSLTFDDKKNTAMIDFIMISEKKMPIVLEFNVFKYEKSKKCGSVAIQYAKRYAATTTMQIEEIKKEFEQDRKKIIGKVKKFKIPDVITTDIDKCISASDIIEQNKQEKIAEEKEKQVIAEAKNGAEAEIAEENSAKEENEKISEETSTDENILKSEEQESIEEAENTENTKEAEDVKLVSEDIKKAPTPDVEESENNIEEASDEKNIKSVSYLYINNKDEYIATPRTKKELKREVKQKKKAQKEAIKQQKKQTKLDKINAKKEKKAALKQQKKQAKLDKINAKNAKKEAKKAEKEAKKTYQVVNSNSDLIAKPRTKKEIKENNKRLKKEAKKRRTGKNI